eukprot:scaffold175787_cov51-Attheya_sp.AAC.1
MTITKVGNMLQLRPNRKHTTAQAPMTSAGPRRPSSGAAGSMWWGWVIGFICGWVVHSVLPFFQYTSTSPCPGVATTESSILSSASASKSLNEKWSSLSSDYTPPRPPPPATLEKNLEALNSWRINSIKELLRPQMCGGNADCLAHNKAAAKKIHNDHTAADTNMTNGDDNVSMTRRSVGYNLQDFQINVEGEIVSLHTLSAGYEKLFQGLKLHSAVTYMGISFQQDPADAFVIGDLLWRLQPDLVIELGTSGGGSAFYYSHIMQEYNPKARLLTIDPAAGKLVGIPLTQWNDWQVKKHCPFCQHSTTRYEWRNDTDSGNGPIRFYRGFPNSDEALAIAREAASAASTVLVIEDSNHLYDSVSGNIKAYHDLVTPGSYMIVQDTRLRGPLKAVKHFLDSDDGRCFDIDKRWEYFIFSQHFDGFLRRRVNCPTTI